MNTPEMQRKIDIARARRVLARRGQRLTVTRSDWDYPRIVTGDLVVTDASTNFLVVSHSTVEDLLAWMDAEVSA